MANFFMVRTKVVNRVQAEMMAKYPEQQVVEEQQENNDENDSQGETKIQEEKESVNSYNSEQADEEAKAQEHEITGKNELNQGEDYVAPYITNPREYGIGEIRVGKQAFNLSADAFSLAYVT